MLILQSNTSTSRVVISGELYDADNNPVVVILELEPKGKRGLVLDEIKVTSAYGKESMQNLVNTSVIRYINPDNTKTSRWLKCTRLQLPFGSTSADSMESIPSNNNVVKKDLKYSLINVPDLELFWEVADMYDDAISSSASILEEGAKAMQGKDVDIKLVRKIAQKMKQEYQSSVNLDTLADNLVKVFSYMQTQDKVNYADMVRVMNEVALPVIKESTGYDPPEMEVYEDFKREVRATSIRLVERLPQKKRRISETPSTAICTHLFYCSFSP